MMFYYPSHICDEIVHYIILYKKKNSSNNSCHMGTTENGGNVTNLFYQCELSEVVKKSYNRIYNSTYKDDG